MSAATLKLKRAYAPAAAGDGTRVLVDRLWPRGLAKREARIDEWAKEVAPTAALRRWFGHDPARWDEFQRRYRAELKDNAALDQLRRLVAAGPVTLVYGARDETHNQAVVLREVLRGTA
jgi:uncharacterized protein YeaO (DUF488 family)